MKDLAGGIPGVLARAAAGRVDVPALRARATPACQATTYGRLVHEIDLFARGLLASGIRPGDRVLLLADNSPRWLVADLGIQRAGAISVPRAADTTPGELTHILTDCAASGAVLGDAGLRGRLPAVGEGLRLPVALSGGGDGVCSFEVLLDRGASETPLPPPAPTATIVYTSGTTGTPKGVMLSPENILHNVRVLPPLIGLRPGDRFLAVLPLWHMFERTVEYTVLSTGGTLTYGTLRTLREDLRAESPDYVAAVPRLWEGVAAAFRREVERRGPVARFLLRRLLSFTEGRRTISGSLVPDRPGGAGFARRLARLVLDAPFALPARLLFGKRIRRATGGRIRAGISGGGLLPLDTDLLFDALGLRLIVGYGLTETAPVAALRSPRRNVLGTIGRAIPETEVRIADGADRPLPPGVAGEIHVRGPQVMTGYYGNSEATARVLAAGGWFRTGDLGSVTPAGDIVFRGRAKETIVLSGGENVEPGPIEARILLSPFVRQALVVGQDRKQLCALLLPEVDRAGAEARARGVSVEALLRSEVARLVSAEAGFLPRERVARVAVLDRDFTVDDGTLTPTLKVRRNVVLELYRDRIEELYRR
ncbi:MAG: AMP-binding protein [Planctomycetes bacterium]|nr:AMP-binding protein [Planctomycetota bacterium]